MVADGAAEFDRDDAEAWAQLSFQKAWRIPRLGRTYFGLGGSYTLSEDGELYPTLASRLNAYLSVYRDYEPRWWTLGSNRLGVSHSSNGELQTKQCTTIPGQQRQPLQTAAQKNAQNGFKTFAPVAGQTGIPLPLVPEPDREVCVGNNNSGTWRLTLSWLR